VSESAPERASRGDAEIFFASVFGATFVVLLHRLLLAYVAAVGQGPLGPALLARTAALASVALLFTFFVLLPAILAVAAIGVPFFLRTLGALVAGRLDAAARNGLLLLAAAAVGALVETRAGGNGAICVTTACALALRFGMAPLAAIGASYGSRMLAAGALALAALAWYEGAVVRGHEAGIALAPTALVAAAFFAAAGVVTTGIAVVHQGAGGGARVLAAAAVVLAWIAAPLVRGALFASAQPADRFELAVAVAASLLLLPLALASRPPNRAAPRGRVTGDRATGG
jgi:hypothetical protein